MRQSSKNQCHAQAVPWNPSKCHQLSLTCLQLSQRSRLDPSDLHQLPSPTVFIHSDATPKPVSHRTELSTSLEDVFIPMFSIRTPVPCVRTPNYCTLKPPVSPACPTITATKRSNLHRRTDGKHVTTLSMTSSSRPAQHHHLLYRNTKGHVTYEAVC